MKKTELIMLKRLLQQETNRRNRINELLTNGLIQEFIVLNNLDIQKLPSDDKWLILEELLKEFKITESNGILVCTGNYIVECRICYEETDYYTKEVPFDDPYTRYQIFQDIETGNAYTAYTDKYIERKIEEENKYCTTIKMTPSEFCHKRYGRNLVSELINKYIVLNPYNSSQNSNGFNEVRKDFFKTAIEKGQPKAKQLVLSKYPQMK